MPEPYWLRRLVTSSDSQGSGFGPSGFGGAAGLAAGAAGLAAAGAGFSPVAAAGAGFAGSLGFAATAVSALAVGAFACDATASAGTTALSTGGVSPPGGGETGFGPLVSSGISLPLVFWPVPLYSGTLSFSSLQRLPSRARVTSLCDRNHKIAVRPRNSAFTHRTRKSHTKKLPHPRRAMRMGPTLYCALERHHSTAIPIPGRLFSR